MLGNANEKILAHPPSEREFSLRQATTNHHQAHTHSRQTRIKPKFMLAAAAKGQTGEH